MTDDIKATLDWYADKAHLAGHEKDITGSGIHALRQDAGERARTAAAALDPVPTPDARERALRKAAEIAGKYHDEAKRAILALIPTGGVEAELTREVEA